MHTSEWVGEADNEELSRSREQPTEETRVLFHHNGNFSGNVKIVLPTRVGAPQTHHYTEPGVGDTHMAEIVVPFDALKSLVLRYLQGQQIEALENMDDEDLERFFVLSIA